MGVTPFFANKSYHPNIAVYSEHKLASIKASKYVTDLEELHAKLCTQMAKAQTCYQEPADHQQEPAPDFQVGQQVYVSTEHIHTTQPSKKLSEKYLGPFDIIACPSTYSFTLQLSNHFCAIHPIFHVSQLEPLVPNTIPNCIQPLPPPIKIDNELEYKIAKILNSKFDNWHRCKLLYFICWSGYKGTDEENSWLPATELIHAQELVSDFHSCHPNKLGPLPL